MSFQMNIETAGNRGKVRMHVRIRCSWRVGRTPEPVADHQQCLSPLFSVGVPFRLSAPAATLRCTRMPKGEAPLDLLCSLQLDPGLSFSCSRFCGSCWQGRPSKTSVSY